MISPKVIIVGAGAAGIAAASKLVASNVCSVTILEAEIRIGGRICTSSFGEGVVELGAQWVHGEKNNVAHSLGTSAGLLSDDSFDVKDAEWVFSDGTVLSDEEADKLYVSCTEVNNDKQKLSNCKESFGDYFNASIKEKFKDKGIEYGSNSVESFLEWYQRVQSSINGSDSCFQVSAAGQLQYEECEGNLGTRWKIGGYKNIFKILMGNNSEKVQENIIFNKRVKTILWDQQPLEVICTDGQKFTADHVLLTVSLGVLKENHSSMFEPSLPFQKINAIQGLSIGTVDKIFIKFPHRWWPENCPGFNLLSRKGDFPPEKEGDWMKEVIGFYKVDDNLTVLCGWIVGSAARHMEQCTDDQVRESCYQLLLRYLGSHYNIPPPESILRSKWQANPNFRGSYSFRSVMSDERNAWAADLASPLPHPGKPVLLFGGEATHDHFYSTVHGAIETGWREADRLISHLHNRMISPKVIIVGAGAAGIAAATKLVASNVGSVTILEAESRIGGRICTSSFGEGIVELGAQWVHGEKNNVAHSLGTSAGLLCDDSNLKKNAKYIFSDGSVLSEKDADKLYLSCKEVASDDQKLCNYKGSFGDYFNERIKEKLNDTGIQFGSNSVGSYLDWYQRFVNSLDGSDSWFQTSAAGQLQYQVCEGNSGTRWKSGGYKSIFKILMGINCGKVKEKIIFNKRVKTILWDQKPLEVICTDGQKFTADHVLLTVSLGVLKENHSSMFEPSLPFQKINAIQGLSIGTVDKIFIKFPHRWWPENCPGFNLLWRKSDLPPENEGGWTKEVFGFYSVNDNSSVMCGWVVGVAARQMEQCSDDQVRDSCYQLLLRFLGSHYNIPSPESILRTKWHVNPNFRGSYSFRSVMSDERNAWAADLASPLPHPGKPVLLFGGEATHDHFYSTVHGAIESGWREADRLISHLQNRFQTA